MISVLLLSIEREYILFLEYPGTETRAVLTGVIAYAGLTNSYIKCANNYKRQTHHDTTKHRSGKTNRLTTSTMVAKHVDWIRQIAMKGNCDKHDGIRSLCSYHK